MLSPPDRALLAACGESARTAPRPAALLDAARGVGWPALLEAAGPRGVTTLLGRTLQKAGLLGQMDRDTRHSLEQRLLAGSVRRRRLDMAAVRLFEQMSATHLSPLLLKGPVLSHHLWSDEAMREYADIDILVAPANFSRATRLLQRQGWATAPITALDTWIAGRAGNGLRFERDGGAGRLIVDLHWRLSGDLLETVATRLPMSATRFSLEDAVVSGPCLLDSVHLLVLHETKNLWSRWIGLCDLARVLALHPTDEFWRTVLERASRLGLRRMHLLGLSLVRQSMRAPLPQFVQQAVDAEAGLQGLARVAAATWRGVEPGREGLLRFHLAALDGPVDRMRALLHYVFTPARSEPKTCRLPVSLAWLYYVIRPLRLAGSLLRRCLCQGGESGNKSGS